MWGLCQVAGIPLGGAENSLTRLPVPSRLPVPASVG